MRTTLILATLALTMTASAQQTPKIPDAYWPEERSATILAKSETITLSPDLSHLSAAEQAAVKELLEVGRIFQDLYEEQKHHQALQARERLRLLDDRLGHPQRTQNLLQLYRLFMGPIATTIENERLPFVDVAPQSPARNMYPYDATKAEIEAFLAAHPEERESILHERTMVRRATKANLDRDLATLASYPALDVLHPNLQHKLKGLARKPNEKAFYAVPYPVAWPEPMTKAYRALRRAADALEPDDAEFAGFLRNRARDLLTNDYESGDAAWVTGRFKRLNGEIGAYETYDDALFGVKAFHAMSVLLANEQATRELRTRLGSLQSIEDMLPYENRKRVRDDISVGVYSIIADFGQARGTNTATILPNDPLYSRRYGRTILLRENIMRNPVIFGANLRTWQAAVAPAHADELKSEGNFQRTLWHEIGHYLGVDRDKQGRTLDVALEDYADAIEEMKSDLVSLFAMHAMAEKGTVSPETLRAVQASGILRTLRNVQPRRDQPYETMQLIQFNYFLANGLLVADPKTAHLTIRYDRYRDVAAALLKETLALQHNGDKAAAAAFFDRWTTWTPELHGQLATRIRDAQGRSRFRIVRYGALGE